MLPTKRIYVFFLTFYSKKNNNTRNKLYTNKLLIDFFFKKEYRISELCCAEIRYLQNLVSIMYSA